MIEHRKVDLIHRMALLGQQDALRRAIREMSTAERCDLVGLISFGRGSGSLAAHLARSHRHGDHSANFICEMVIADSLDAAFKKASRRWRETLLPQRAA